MRTQRNHIQECLTGTTPQLASHLWMVKKQQEAPAATSVATWVCSLKCIIEIAANSPRCYRCTKGTITHYSCLILASQSPSWLNYWGQDYQKDNQMLRLIQITQPDWVSLHRISLTTQPGHPKASHLLSTTPRTLTSMGLVHKGRLRKEFSNSVGCYSSLNCCGSESSLTQHTQGRISTFGFW